MRAVSGDLPPDGDRGAFEIKWDGVRAIAFVEDGARPAAELEPDRHHGAVPRTAGLGDALAGAPRSSTARSCASTTRGGPASGSSSTACTSRRPREARERAADTPVCYLLFDILHVDGEDVTPRPYVERRRVLEDLVDGRRCWQVPAWHAGDGAALLEAARTRGLEGLVAKRLDSRYEPGKRSPNWRKVKIRRQQELVIGGWQPGRGNRERLPRLAPPRRTTTTRGVLRYAGKVGTGFKERDLRLLQTCSAERAVDCMPVRPAAAPAVARLANYVRPELVAQIAFGEWTSEGNPPPPVLPRAAGRQGGRPTSSGSRTQRREAAPRRRRCGRPAIMCETRSMSAPGAPRG